MSHELRLRTVLKDLRGGGDINYVPRLVYILACGSDTEILEFKELIFRHWDALSCEIPCSYGSIQTIKRVNRLFGKKYKYRALFTIDTSHHTLGLRYTCACGLISNTEGNLRYESARDQVYSEILCLDAWMSNPNILREMIEYLL